MFFLGLLIGALVVGLLVAWAYLRLGLSASSAVSYRASAAIADIERRTIEQLLDSQRYQSPAAASSLEVIEGTAIEMRPRP
jgi:hypothetical protein